MILALTRQPRRVDVSRPGKRSRAVAPQARRGERQDEALLARGCDGWEACASGWAGDDKTFIAKSLFALRGKYAILVPAKRKSNPQRKAMAKRKTQTNSANLGFEQVLWAAADKLRGFTLCTHIQSLGDKHDIIPGPGTGRTL